MTVDHDFSNEKEIKLIKGLLTPNSISIDLGANVGVFTKVLAEHSKHVYAFEPDPHNFYQLKQNMEPYNDKVSLYPYAASNITGATKLYRSTINDGMHRVYKSKLAMQYDEPIEVVSMQVDDVIPDNVKIDFIKMDVEGFELFVIFGMMKILERDKPKIMTEFHPDSIRESGGDPEMIFDILTRRFKYNYPIHCITSEVLTTYEKLEKATNDPKGGVNILFT